jgi:photosystem II stability/assembly factor-like uncharacterized protein
MIAFLFRWLARLSPWMFIASLAYAALFIELSADQSSLTQPLLEKRDRFFGAAAAGEDLWFVGGDGVLLETTDAGLTWERQQLPGEVNLQSTAASPDGVRVVVGNQARVFVGRVGQQSWESYVLPRPEYASKLNQVRFFDDAFWVVGEMGGVYRLSADGLTWADLSLGEDFSLNSIARSPDGTLWLAGEYGNLFSSQDQGASWQQLTLSEETLRSMAFNGDEAVVVGNGGQVFVSADQGVTWNQQPAFTPEHLFDVAWDGKRWVAVGDQGQVFSAEAATGTWIASTPEGMSKTYFMSVLPTDSGMALAGKTLGFIDNNNRWANWPVGE